MGREGARNSDGGVHGVLAAVLPHVRHPSLLRQLLRVVQQGGERHNGWATSTRHSAVIYTAFNTDFQKAFTYILCRQTIAVSPWTDLNLSRDSMLQLPFKLFQPFLINYRDDPLPPSKLGSPIDPLTLMHQRRSCPNRQPSMDGGFLTQTQTSQGNGSSSSIEQFAMNPVTSFEPLTE
ncbi:hypothetical protein CEXT_530011 [Caerostris extrusa]|uniref:Uncharacterized protein n=1 Tax=Caerostris extrusa TaxID=172846 RepID=A0AAV4QDE3_CAEEX|nr:hypothetical protein CEXT_530011 [Caerostris extrusa]